MSKRIFRRPNRDDRHIYRVRPPPIGIPYPQRLRQGSRLCHLLRAGYVVVAQPDTTLIPRLSLLEFVTCNPVLPRLVKISCVRMDVYEIMKRHPRVKEFLPLRRVFCCVLSCDSYSVVYEGLDGPRKVAGVDMYRFPESKYMMNEWYNFNKRAFSEVVPFVDNLVCAHHFRSNDFMYFYHKTKKTLLKKMLRENAVPSVFYDIEEIFDDFNKYDLSISGLSNGF